MVVISKTLSYTENWSNSVSVREKQDSSFLPRVKLSAGVKMTRLPELRKHSGLLLSARIFHIQRTGLIMSMRARDKIIPFEG